MHDAEQFPAGVWGNVMPVLQAGRIDHETLLGIPDDEVGVIARRYRAAGLVQS